MTNRYGVLLGLVLSACALAEQTQEVTDNGRAALNISAGDMTRLWVQGDRIGQVVGLKGAYHLQEDEATGEVYLQPTAPQRTCTVQLVTERGQHVTLVLNPLKIPSDSVRLVFSPKGGTGDGK